LRKFIDDPSFRNFDVQKHISIWRAIVNLTPR